MTPSLRTGLVPLVVAGLVLLAGCSAPFGTAQAAPDGESNAGPSIAATGVGTVEADPDLAVVRLSVVAVADSADAARADAADRTDRLVAALRDAGVDEEDVATVGYHLGPRYDYRAEQRELVGYRAVHSLTVEVAPDRAGAVVDAAVGAAEVTVDGVQFTLSDETRQQLREEAVAAAVADARSDADAAASAAGLTVTGVDTMTVGGSGPVFPVRYAEATADAGGKTSFQPGPVTVRVSVQVTYRAG